MKRSVFSTAALIALVGCSSMESGSTDTSSSMDQANPIADFEATPTQRAEVVATLQKLFDALETGDAALLRSIMDPSVVMHSSDTRNGTTIFGSATLDGLATRITSSEVPLIERMWDPVVVVNGPLATIWTPYDFYSGTEFSHCGVDAANMLNTPEGWRIVALSWTRLQPPACDLHPDGPPSS